MMIPARINRGVRFLAIWSKAMKSVSKFLLMLILVLYAPDCSNVNGIPKSPPCPIGEYRYTGYDKKGKKIIEGRLTVSSCEGDRIRGGWLLKKVGNPARIGPQIGSGGLIGLVSRDKVSINLNPQMADNNVKLKGTLQGNRYYGTWSWDGFTGGMNQGTFKALKE
jgi:hypothetical protein